MFPRSLPSSIRSRGVTAVLGPTNTGKTHLAIERMIGHGSGMIGLPLRLLAREVYQRVVDRVGPSAVALVTGEEKIKPPDAKFWVATVEAMPRDIQVPFVAIDEIQLAADRDRGHVFTDRLLNMRGRAETLLIGAATMRPLIEQLLPGVAIVSRPRLSTLSFAGEKKITRLPRRSAIVAFSADEVYAIAEVIRRQRGGAAVVLGALSPRTRNAQVALYQSGDVDFLIATDAIGMGLNLDLDHVAFAADRKFDGAMHRRLTPGEFGQIAGRAGRHLRDGTFGTTGRCEPFEPELVERLEDHNFDAMNVLQWRNVDLDFGSVARLVTSLEQLPTEPGLTRAIAGEDLVALEIAARDPELAGFASTPATVERLWEVCQVPDYRRVAPQAHADLVATLFRQLMRQGRVANDWFARQVAEIDRTDGDIDTLSNRIAQVRTWTFVANRPDWLRDPEHWQGVTRQVEDRLSDALHERLTQRFVDRRTSVLLRRLRENAMLEAEITAAGDVLVEGHPIGRLQGFQFAPDPQAGGPDAKALRNAAMKALAGEIETRAARLAGAGDDAFVLSNDGALRWQGEAVARLVAGDKLLEPRLRLLADEQLTGGAREQVQGRLDAWIKAHVERLLGGLLKLEDPASLSGIARGLGFQIAEALGVLERSRVADEVKGLDQEARAALRNLGVRFGAYHLTVPALLKPAPRSLAAQLWALKHGGPEVHGLSDILHLAASGRTSIPVDKEVHKGLYRAAGFRVCGERAVRVDILERLADLIRPAIHYRPGATPGEPPPGTADGEGFVVTTSMTSLCGCAGEDFASILRSLGYVMDRRAGPAITVPLLKAAPTAPAAPAAAETPAAGEAQPEAASEGAMATEDGTPPAEAATETPAADATPAAEAPAQDVVAQDVVAQDVAAPESVAQDSAAQESVTEQPAATEASAEAPATDAPAEEAPAEVPLIEVWRQHRHQGGRHQNNRRPQPRRGEGTGPAEGRERGPRDGQRRDRGPRQDRPAGGERPAAAQGASTEATAERAPRPDRQDRPGGQDRSGGQGRQDRPARPQGEGRQDRGERRDQRPPRRDDRPDGGRGPRPQGGRPGGPRPDRDRGDRQDRSWSSERPSRDRAPDPNSPFAKLLALKAELEAKQGKD
ncbi:helicase-related protein [uncultured Alsobacter sp.]|uniref:helicase-related protein n=1 Tax=uncultured Alsobacter sp. TaxID=1748258 RepID=UPI0025CF20C5|nr:helicase-related protein [uncultured Alsobacter sp.]